MGRGVGEGGDKGGSAEVPVARRLPGAAEEVGGVERTFAWLGQARRLAKDYERLPETAVAMIYYWAMSRIMLLRRLLVSAVG